MKHYLGYHNGDERGRYEVERKGTEDRFFTGKRFREETLIQNRLWVIEGLTSPEGKGKQYNLLTSGIISHLTPTKSDGGANHPGQTVHFRIDGNVPKKNQELTQLLWFKRLLKQQQSFRLGFNRITDRRIITRLEARRVGRQAPERKRTSRQNLRQVIKPREPLNGQFVAMTSALEGVAMEAHATRYGRNRRLRLAALHRAAGICGVCLRDFRKILPRGRGMRVLQVHHRKQLSAARVPRITRVSDLVAVCANCHTLLHLNPKRALRPSALRKMLREPTSST